MLVVTLVQVHEAVSGLGFGEVGPFALPAFWGAEPSTEEGVSSLEVNVLKL